MPEVAFKKVTARGKKYVYLRGTDIALVKGFEGTDTELEGLLTSYNVQQTIADYYNRQNATLNGWRVDASKMLQKAAHFIRNETIYCRLI